LPERFPQLFPLPSALRLTMLPVQRNRGGDRWYQAMQVAASHRISFRIDFTEYSPYRNRKNEVRAVLFFVRGCLHRQLHSASNDV
jgi:hypothetical protein